MSEPLPCVKHVQPWTTKPKGPFRLVVGATYWVFDTLEEAVGEFARLAMPADIHEGIAHVTDHHGVIAIAYIHRGSTVEWGGVKDAFDVLADVPHMHPLEVVMAEIAARDRCPS